MLALLSAAAPLSFSPPVNDDSCPKVKTIGTLNFNLTEWTRKTWFIQVSSERALKLCSILAVPHVHCPHFLSRMFTDIHTLACVSTVLLSRSSRSFNTSSRRTFTVWQRRTICTGVIKFLFSRVQ